MWCKKTKCTHFFYKNSNKDWKVFCLLSSKVVLFVPPWRGFHRSCGDWSRLAGFYVHISLAQKSQTEKRYRKVCGATTDVRGTDGVSWNRKKKLLDEGKDPETKDKKKTEMKNVDGHVDIKKHKQILCSFITKYSATINIAFISPFHLCLEDSSFASFFPPPFCVLNTCWK